MSQQWNASEYARHGRFVADLAEPVMALLEPMPGQRILDLGCGDGVLMERLALQGARVVGVDSSLEMVQAAVARGQDARLLRGEDLLFEHEFDAVFSNAALHWMADQRAVLKGVHRALRAGGRFVAELGGHGNIAAIRTALHVAVAPFGLDAEQVAGNYFFTAKEYTRLLEEQAFHVEVMELVPRPTRLPSDVRAWLETFRQALLQRLTPDQRASVLQQVSDTLRPILRDAEGNWWADYVRLRFRAIA